MRAAVWHGYKDIRIEEVPGSRMGERRLGEEGEDAP